MGIRMTLILKKIYIFNKDFCNKCQVTGNEIFINSYKYRLYYTFIMLDKHFMKLEQSFIEVDKSIC